MVTPVIYSIPPLCVPLSVIENLNGCCEKFEYKNLYFNPLINSNFGFLTPLIKNFPPESVTVISTISSVPKSTLFNFNAPVISVFELTLKPFVFEMDAVAAPSAIRVKLRPVTPLAGILYKFVPSPLNEPVNDPVV